jgi:hypothetical protein
LWCGKRTAESAREATVGWGKPDYIFYGCSVEHEREAIAFMR